MPTANRQNFKDAIMPNQDATGGKRPRYRKPESDKRDKTTASPIDIMANLTMSQTFRGYDETEGTFIGFGPIYFLEYDYAFNSYTASQAWADTIGVTLFQSFLKKFNDVFRLSDSFQVSDMNTWIDVLFKGVRAVVTMRHMENTLVGYPEGSIPRAFYNDFYTEDLREALDRLENVLLAEYYPPTLVSWIKWLYKPMSYNGRVVIPVPADLNPDVATPTTIVQYLTVLRADVANANSSTRKIARLYKYYSGETRTLIDLNVTTDMSYSHDRHDIWGNRFYDDTISFRPDVAGKDATWRFMLSVAKPKYYVGANLPFFNSTSGIEQSFTPATVDRFSRLNEDGTISACLTGEYTAFGFQNLTNAGATNQIQPFGAYPIYYNIRNQQFDQRYFLIAAFDLGYIGYPATAIKGMTARDAENNENTVIR